MEIRESELFIKQVFALSKRNSYSKVAEDVNDLKIELPRLAFKNLPPINKPLYELAIPKHNCLRVIWRVRIANSNNNKGKRAGYRIFYCQADGSEVVLLLGIFPRQEINDSEYRKVSEDLVEAINESDWC